MREADREHMECAAQQLWIPGFYAGDSYRVSQSAERDLVWLDDWSETCSFGGNWYYPGRIQQGATLDMLKKIGIDWNLTGRFRSVVHLPSDDLRQVLSGDRRRGGDTSRSSRTETISTTRPHSPNVSATRGNLEAM